jgi:hypothetical protein
MSLNYKRLYHSVPWISAIGLTLVFVFFMAADLNEHRQMWEERLAWNAQTQQQYVHASGRDLTQQSMLLAQLIARDPIILDKLRAAQLLFAAADSANNVAQLRTARKELQVLLQDYWGGMATAGAKQLSVYFAPGAVNFFTHASAGSLWR